MMATQVDENKIAEAVAKMLLTLKRV